MSNKLTDAQSELLIQYATEKANGRVGIMHDADIEGDAGAKESLWRLSVAGLNPYLIWSRDKDNGRFKNREPESLDTAAWHEMAKEMLKHQPVHTPKVAESDASTTIHPSRI